MAVGLLFWPCIWPPGLVIHRPSTASHVIHNADYLGGAGADRWNIISCLPGSERRALWSAVANAAEPYGGVLSRRQLRQLGVHRDVVRRAVHADTDSIRQSKVALHNRLLTQREHWWRAVWEVGIDVAALNGVSARLCAGLGGYSDEAVHISVLHSHRPGQPSGTTIHKVIRRTPGERRSRPAAGSHPIAAVRAANGRAPTASGVAVGHDRTTTACSAGLIGGRPYGLPGASGRAFIKRILADVASGAQSLGSWISQP